MSYDKNKGDKKRDNETIEAKDEKEGKKEMSEENDLNNDPKVQEENDKQFDNDSEQRRYPEDQAAIDDEVRVVPDKE